MRMRKYKICVYAISKNEEKFVDRWYNTVKEADKVIVLDTGSTDNTVESLRKKGVEVYEKKIIPWRFDVARNMSLSLIPYDYDICVCIDLDEVIEPGWTEKLEHLWDSNTTRLRYNYNWSLDENGNPLVNFYIEKIHSREDYKWINPVHEVLSYVGNGKEFIKTTDEITINHYPDDKKSRNSYLPLLELAVKENPNNDRNVHYLGREYMYYGKWNESIDTLIKHLALPTATWKDERCASMRFIARCYKKLGRYEESKMWLNKAINEAPYLRDPLIELAILNYELKEWDQVIENCNKALLIKKHQKTYINEIFSWNETVYDLLSIAYFYIGNKIESLKNVNLALEINPNEKRLIKNKKLITESIEVSNSY